MSVSAECRADSGVSAPGPGAGRRRRARENLWELVRNCAGKERERGRARGEGGEGGAGRDRSGEGLNSITSQLLLFGGVSSDHKP